MRQNNSFPAESLLNLLLDRHEEPKARLRGITQRIDYKQVGGPAAQDALGRRSACNARSRCRLRYHD
jgi:hypothetical protein